MKTCKCAFRWTDAEWLAAEALVGPVIDVPDCWEDCDCPARGDAEKEHAQECAGRGYRMELINCPKCKSTLARAA